MSHGLHTARTAMQTANDQVRTITGNIAKLGVPGGKKDFHVVTDLFYQVDQYAGRATSSTTLAPSGVQFCVGVRTDSTAKIFTDGSFKETGNDLDVAITGKGFFQIQLPNGNIGYTEAGNFKKDNNGNIVTSEGYQLIPNIVIPADTTEISIGKDGTVSVQQAGQTAVTQVGQIEIVNFINPTGLHALGGGLLINTSASGDPITGTPGFNGLGQLRQGFLEMSNIVLVAEMTDLIEGHRAYDTGGKCIQTWDGMKKTCNDLKR
jgi:flagellar basal-body rod protein FlgG